MLSYLVCRHKESGASLISTALLYYPNLIKTDFISHKTMDTPVHNLTKYNTESILLAIHSSIGCDPSVDKILSVTLAYFLANPHESVKCLFSTHSLSL